MVKSCDEKLMLILFHAVMDDGVSTLKISRIVFGAK